MKNLLLLLSLIFLFSCENTDIPNINNKQTRISGNTKLIKDHMIFGLDMNYMDRKSGLFVIWDSDTNAYVPLGETNTPNSGNRFYVDPSFTFYHNSFKHIFRSRILSRNLIYNTKTKNNSLMTFNEYQNQFHKENTTLTSGFTLVTLKGKTNGFGTFIILFLSLGLPRKFQDSN